MTSNGSEFAGLARSSDWANWPNHFLGKNATVWWPLLVAAGATILGSVFSLPRFLSIRVKPFQPSDEDAEKSMVAGLVNRRNTCFFNALMQAFAGCPSFASSLQKAFIILNDSGEGHKSDCAVSRELFALLSELMPLRREPAVIDPTALLRFLKHACGPVFEEFGDQQDTLEALTLLQTVIQAEFDTAKTCSAARGLRDLLAASDASRTMPGSQCSTASVLSWPLNGTLVTSTSCVHCHFQYSSEAQEYQYITLARPMQRSMDSIRSIPELLNDYTSPERVEGVMCPACSHAAAQRLISTILFKITLKKANLAIFDNRSEGQPSEHNSASRQNACASDMQNISLILQEVLSLISCCKTPQQCACEQEFASAMQACMEFPQTIKISSLELHINNSRWPSSHGPAVRRTMLGCIPQVACIHLPRLYMSSSGVLVKSQEHVVFPLMLDMSPFQLLRLYNKPETEIQQTGPGKAHILNLPGHSEPHSAHSWQREEPASYIVDQGLSHPARSQTLHQDVYHLAAVIVHYGQANSGHYVTYRRGFDFDFNGLVDDSPQWFRVSDEDVLAVGIEEVLNANASVLFYVKNMDGEPS